MAEESLLIVVDAENYPGDFLADFCLGAQKEFPMVKTDSSDQSWGRVVLRLKLSAHDQDPMVLEEHLVIGMRSFRVVCLTERFLDHCCDQLIGHFEVLQAEEGYPLGGFEN